MYSDLVLLVSPGLQGFSESAYSPEDAKLKMVYYQTATRRQYPVQVTLQMDAPWEIQYRTQKFFLMVMNGGDAVNGFHYLVDRDTGRSLRLPAGIVQVSDEHELIAVQQGLEILLYDFAGEVQGRVTAPARWPQLHDGGLAYGAGNDTYMFFDLATRTVRQVTRSERHPREPLPVEPPYYVSLDYGVEPAPNLVGHRLWVMPVDLPQQNDPAKKPHEVPRPVEPVGSVHGAWIIDGDLYYIQSLRLFRRKIEPVDDELYKAKIASEFQARAMHIAGVAGTVLSIYAADHDAFPEGDWRAKLEPYMRNGSALNGFTYAGNPGHPTSLERITEVPLGWVETPYGRAIVYADSSVRWKPTP